MANSTIQTLPLKKRFTSTQQTQRQVRIAARAHARDILQAQIGQQRQAINFLMMKEYQRPVNKAKRAVARVFSALKPSRWQKQQAQQKDLSIFKVRE